MQSIILTVEAGHVKLYEPSHFYQSEKLRKFKHHI